MKVDISFFGYPSDWRYAVNVEQEAAYGDIIVSVLNLRKIGAQYWHIMKFDGRWLGVQGKDL